MFKGKQRTPILVLAMLTVAGWALSPLAVGAATSGSYAHPDIKGPDEGNPMGRALRLVVPPSAKEGSTSKAKPSTKREGSAKKGYGPGAHPKKYKEGSAGKKYGHGHGKGYRGPSSHHGKKHHAKEGSKKRYGHGKGYGHKKGHSMGGHHGKKSGSHSAHASSGHGRHGYQGHKTNPFRHILKFREKLGLTSGQVKSIMRMRFNWEKQRIKLGADLMIAHMELDRLVHSGVLNEAKMHEMAKLIGGLKMQKVQIMVEAKIALLKALTEEQRKRVAEVHSRH